MVAAGRGDLCRGTRPGHPVLLDAAQLAPHRPLPPEPDFIAFSGHKLYAPYGAGALIGPRDVFTSGDPFLAGGGAVDLVDLDEVIWTEPPEREEAGSPNVIGAIAFGAAMDELERIGWDTITRHEAALSAQLHEGLRAIHGVHVLGPATTPGAATLAVAAFTVDGMHHGLVAARLSAEFGIGVRHGCFCAHPYLLRLLGVGAAGVAEARAGRPARRPERNSRRSARQLRLGDIERGRRHTVGRPADCYPRRPGTGALRAGQRDR